MFPALPRKSGRAGVASLELALLSPVFLLFFTGVADFSMVYHQELQLASVLTAGGEYGFTSGQLESGSALTTDVTNFVKSLSVTSLSSITATYNNGLVAADYYCVSGSPATYTGPPRRWRQLRRWLDRRQVPRHHRQLHLQRSFQSRPGIRSKKLFANRRHKAAMIMRRSLAAENRGATALEFSLTALPLMFLASVAPTHVLGLRKPLLSEPRRKKFFGSFFQRRTASLPNARHARLRNPALPTRLLRVVRPKPL